MPFSVTQMDLDCYTEWSKSEKDKYHVISLIWDFPCGSDSKESACNAGDLGSIPGLGRSPGERNGNPPQYSCLENPMDSRDCQATVHGVAKSRIRLSNFTLTHWETWLIKNLSEVNGPLSSGSYWRQLWRLPLKTRKGEEEGMASLRSGLKRHPKLQRSRAKASLSTQLLWQCDRATHTSQKGNHKV